MYFKEYFKKTRGFGIMYTDQGAGIKICRNGCPGSREKEYCRAEQALLCSGQLKYISLPGYAGAVYFCGGARCI